MKCSLYHSRMSIIQRFCSGRCRLDRWGALLTLFGFFLSAFPLSACKPAVVRNDYFGTVTGFPSDEITALACDHQGIVYVGTKDTGLVVIQPRSRQWSYIVDESRSLSFNAIHSLRLDRNNHLLVGTAGGLNDIDLSDLRPSSRLFAEDGLKDNIVMSVVRDPNGSTLWAGTTMGLVKMAASVQQFTEKDGLAANLIHCLQFDDDGMLWLGTSSGAMVKTGNDEFRRVALTTKDFSSSDWVTALSLSRPESPRAANASGTDKFDSKLQLTYEALQRGIQRREKPSMLGEIVKDFSNRVASFSFHPALYAATNNGLFVIDRDTRSGEMIREGWYTALAVNPLGNVFAARNDLTVHAIGISPRLFPGFDISRLIRATLKERLTKEINDAFAENLAGQATDPLLLHLKNMTDEDREAWIGKKLMSNSITAMTFDPEGNLWIGLDQGGLFKFHPEIVNQDSFSFAVRKFQESGAEFSGFSLEIPLDKGASIEEVEEGKGILAQTLAETGKSSLKIGAVRWSELPDNDCQILAEFLGQWSLEICISHFAEFLPYDPYVIVPVGDPSP